MRAPDTGDRAPGPAGTRSPHDGPDGHPVAPADHAVAAPGADGDRTGSAAPAPGIPAGPWPTVRPPSTRAVLAGKTAAVLGAVWYCVVFSIATDVLARAEYLLAGVVTGGALCALGVVLLWLYSPRTPARVAPARGPEMGLARDRAEARTVLRSGAAPDTEQRRLVAVDVQADAPLPLVTGATFAPLGPLVVAVANTGGPLPWLGPATAGLILLVLAGLAWRTWSAYMLHRVADRRHTVPRFAGSGAPWRPWP
ncbi:hypothetical protein [Pseudonocardia sp. NPDC049635]|uniref:hypothetical protein n=1 Tax=Pseudonocardia sp. NPDC049635 TaxID=3155506 RepID=UPI0033C8345F